MAMTEQHAEQRGRWGLVYAANQDGDSDYPLWELQDSSYGDDATILADCTEAELRDLAAACAAACGAVVVSREALWFELEQAHNYGWVGGANRRSDALPDGQACADAALDRLTAAPVTEDTP